MRIGLSQDDLYLIHELRIIRDRAWQCGRIDPAFSQIETLAESALRRLGIENTNLGNPRKPIAMPEGYTLKTKVTRG